MSSYQHFVWWYIYKWKPFCYFMVFQYFFVSRKMWRIDFIYRNWYKHTTHSYTFIHRNCGIIHLFVHDLYIRMKQNKKKTKKQMEFCFFLQRKLCGWLKFWYFLEIKDYGFFFESFSYVALLICLSTRVFVEGKFEKS